MPQQWSDWDVIASAPFVALTTYRRSGVGVSTPVWIAADGGRLVVTTEVHTGKVKRLRHDPRVRLQPCSRLGQVHEEQPAVEARAAILGPNEQHRSATEALRHKYGVQYTAFLLVERLVRRVQRKPGERVIIGIERPSA